MAYILLACQLLVHPICVCKHNFVSGGVSVGGASNNMFVNTFLFQVSGVCLGLCLQVYLLAPPASGETTTASFFYSFINHTIDIK